MQEMFSAIQKIPEVIAKKCPLAIRLLEQLHKDPETWLPYKELFLPECIQSEVTITPEELRDRLNRMPLSISSEKTAKVERSYNQTQIVFSKSLKVLTQLADLAVPGADITPAELTWAFNVVQTRAVNRSGSPELIPLFDMFNHAPDPACEFCEVTEQMYPGIRASMAVEADPSQLRVVETPGRPGLLFRRERKLCGIDDCVIVLAPTSGLRAGSEAFYEYRDMSKSSPDDKIRFLMQYGFFPGSGTPG